MSAADLTVWLNERVAFSNVGRSNWERGWREFNCPFHPDDGAHFGWHAGRGWGHCWVCGWRGGALRLVMGMAGCGAREAAVILREQPALGPWEDFGVVCWDPEGASGCAWPDGARSVYEGRGLLESRCYEYLRGRIGEAAIVEYGWRWVARGDLRGCVVCPVHERGEMVYWVARSTTRRAVYRYPCLAESGGVGKGEVLFNLDWLERGGRAVLVEGVFDAIAQTRAGERWEQRTEYGHVLVGPQVGVALLGKHLGAVQAAKLALAEPGAVDVYLDADAAREADAAAEALSGYGIGNVRVLRGAGDPDEGPGEQVSFAARLRERL